MTNDSHQREELREEVSQIIHNFSQEAKEKDQGLRVTSLDTDYLCMSDTELYMRQPLKSRDKQGPSNRGGGFKMKQALDPALNAS